MSRRQSIFPLIFLVWTLAALAGCGKPPLVYKPDLHALVEAPRNRNIVDELWLINTAKATVPESHLYEDGGKAKVDIPILCAMIRRGETYHLVDTGLNHHFAFRPKEYLGGLLEFAAKNFYRLPSMEKGQDVVAQIAKLGVAPDRVKTVINTHAHFDHTGENPAFTGARIVVGPGEKAFVERAFGTSRGVMRSDFDLKRVREADFKGSKPIWTFAGRYDLFEDGSVIIVPTPGHTPGSISVLVNTAAGDFLLVGDAAYTMTNIERPVVMGYVENRDEAFETLARLADLHQSPTPVTILPFHDPAVWKDCSAPPRPLHQAAKPPAGGNPSL